MNHQPNTHFFSYCADLETMCVLIATETACYLSTTSTTKSETLQLFYETEVKAKDQWTYKPTYDFKERPTSLKVQAKSFVITSGSSVFVGNIGEAELWRVV